MNAPVGADLFREEAAEILSALEVALLELEERPQDQELVGSVFRALHTIKGSGAMFGFDSIATFAHEVETVFDRVRDGLIPVTRELVGVALAARDHIQHLLSDNAADVAATAAEGAAILQDLRRVADEHAPPAAKAPQPEAAKLGDTAKSSGESQTYRIRFAPSPELLQTGANPLLLIEELRQLGDLNLIAHLDEIPALDRIEPTCCYVVWDFLLTTASAEDAIRDVFIFVEDRASIEIQRLEVPTADEEIRVGHILANRGDVSQEKIDQLLSSRPKTGDILVEEGLVSRERVNAALLEQQHLKAQQEKRRAAEALATLRVPAGKLDRLVNIVGELVTVQARLSGYALDHDDPVMSSIAEEVERLTEMLRENTMNIRMLPIGDTFGRFKRLVRDLSDELGKKVELVAEGSETELDKTVIEQLGDPLLHLVRNAVDHGLESPEERARSGKAPVGRICLSASHAGAFVVIAVSDDGPGLNRAAIRRRAIERGMISDDASLSDGELDELIFQPGFSTAAHVTGISGRGVGMDVVRRKLDALRGRVSVSSIPGRGTTFTLRIPLTLAIIDGLLVEVGNSYFVIPLASVSECIELKRGGTAAARRSSLVCVRDKQTPYFVLRERFGIAGEPPPIEQVIIAETNDGRYGFVVDRVIGDHHAVIKKLGGLYRHVDEISGATILGDGTVALVLDVGRLAAAALREER